jgi:hypothetical protein
MESMIGNIKKILEKRILFLKTGLTEEEALKHEVYMIAVFGRKDLGTGILWNFTDGGEGLSNPGEEIRNKIRTAKLGKPTSLKGKTYEEIYGENFLEKIERLRVANSGKRHSGETKQKISNSKKGASAWNKGKSIDSKYVYKLLSPEGNIVVTTSLSYTCKENGLNVACMRRLMNGKQKQHKGWTFLERTFPGEARQEGFSDSASVYSGKVEGKL